MNRIASLSPAFGPYRKTEAKRIFFATLAILFSCIALLEFFSWSSPSRYFVVVSHSSYELKSTMGKLCYSRSSDVSDEKLFSAITDPASHFGHPWSFVWGGDRNNHYIYVPFRTLRYATLAIGVASILLYGRPRSKVGAICLTGVAALFMSNDMSDNLELQKMRLIDQIQERVRAEIDGECVVVYSTYPLDENGLPVDNLDSIAVKGKVQVVDEIWDSYIGEVLEDPTWLQLAVEANRMIIASGDYHHVSFEAVDEMEETEEGVTILSLDLGS